MTALQYHYLGVGRYEYTCSECGESIITTLRVLDYFASDPPHVMSGFPIKYCWHCGLKFEHIERIMKI